MLRRLRHIKRLDLFWSIMDNPILGAAACRWPNIRGCAIEHSPVTNCPIPCIFTELWWSFIENSTIHQSRDEYSPQ
jgi:hypothetical protein